MTSNDGSISYLNNVTNQSLWYEPLEFAVERRDSRLTCRDKISFGVLEQDAGLSDNHVVNPDIVSKFKWESNCFVSEQNCLASKEFSSIPLKYWIRK